MKQKELAAALKGIILLCLVAGLLVCGLLVPEFGREIAAGNPNYAYLFWPCLLFVWLTCVPVLIVLGLVWQMAGRIGADNSFCNENARALKGICLLACIDIGLYLIAALIGFILFHGLPFFLLVFLFLVLCVGIAIAVVTAALSHIVQKGADMKAEQDLTI